MKYHLIALIAALLTTTAYAQQHHHTHGKAQLYLTYASSQLHVEFNSPAMDVLGFEGEPATDQQKQAVQQLKQTLSKPAALFTLGGNRCGLKSQHTDISQDHHSDVHASYQFTCEGEPAPDISLTLFDQFPSLHQVEVFAIINDKQQYRTLDANSEAWKF